MKKIFLASDSKCLYGVGMDTIGIPKSSVKMLYVTTASKGSKNLEYVPRHRQMLRDGQFQFDEIDIEGKSKEELEEIVKDKNVINVEGGNTFYLLKALKETGFDIIIKQFLERGGVYVGTSAGAYIACPTIEVSTWGPDTRDRFGLTDFSALNLVPFLLKVHYTDDMKDWLFPKINESKLPVRILRDGQGILVDGNSYRLVGEGEEVKI